MKLITYIEGGQDKRAIAIADEVYKLDELGFTGEFWELDLEAVKKAAFDGKLKKEVNVYSLDQIKITTPIPYPKQDVICLGINYAQHAEESARYKKEAFLVDRKYATYFSKRVNRGVGSGEVVDSHSDMVERLDYEAELAVVIGKDCNMLFKEKLNLQKKVAMCFAVAAVIIMIVHFGKVPWVALSLGVSFAVYAAIKKRFAMPPVLSLLYETMFLVPIALIGIIYLETTGAGALGMIERPLQYGLLLLAGVATAIPLGLFAFAANRINLITLGVTEYIAPSISLLLGIFLFAEPFDKTQFMACCLIWVGLVFFTIGEIKDA